jgi:taurine dioxygenase
MYLAYETLSDGMKRMIQELFCVHPGATHEFKQTDPPVAQPLVRVHPETSRKSLYLTEKVKKFVGMTEEESKPLVHFLCQHAGRAPFVYRHVWQKNDLVIWDNRCMWHNAVGDYDRSETRHMERTTVLGTPSGGYVYEEKVASAS